MGTALTLSTGDYPLEQAIALWLHEKGKRSNSEKTRRAYEDTLASFRRMLRLAGLDLDSPSREVATIAQGWAALPKPDGKVVAAATHNQRLAIVSSFYAFCRKRRVLTVDNPIETIDRRKVQDYASAQPLDANTVQQRMAAIERDTDRGKRDYALLAVALQTGRRLSELAFLRTSDLDTSRLPVTITFTRAKGGKVMRDLLSYPVSKALMEYLRTVYPNGIPSGDAPVWLDLHSRDGSALSIRSLSNICMKHLGTGKMHTTRHTFAHGMEKIGARVSTIQARLGHSNLATTGRYLSALSSAENEHGDELTALFGLE